MNGEFLASQQLPWFSSQLYSVISVFLAFFNLLAQQDHTGGLVTATLGAPLPGVASASSLPPASTAASSLKPVVPCRENGRESAGPPVDGGAE